MINIEKAIYELMKTKAGGRVYDRRAPQNAEAPFIVYQRKTSTRWRDINGPSGWTQADIMVDCYGETATASKDLALEIEELLDGYDGNVTIPGNSPADIANLGISLQEDSDMLDQTEEPFLYRNSAIYLLTYKTQGV